MSSITCKRTAENRPKVEASPHDLEASQYLSGHSFSIQRTLADGGGSGRGARAATLASPQDFSSSTWSSRLGSPDMISSPAISRSNVSNCTTTEPTVDDQELTKFLAERCGADAKQEDVTVANAAQAKRSPRPPVDALPPPPTSGSPKTTATSPQSTGHALSTRLAGISGSGRSPLQKRGSTPNSTRQLASRTRSAGAASKGSSVGPETAELHEEVAKLDLFGRMPTARSDTPGRSDPLGRDSRKADQEAAGSFHPPGRDARKADNFTSGPKEIGTNTREFHEKIAKLRFDPRDNDPRKRENISKTGSAVQLQASRENISKTGSAAQLQDMMNDEDAPVTLGNNLDSCDGLGTYYCGRKLGTSVIPGSDGRCGPKNGPNCPSCKRFTRHQAMRLRNDEGAPVCLGDITQSSDGICNYYCGRYLGPVLIPGSDGRCGPTNGPQCQSCKRFQSSQAPAQTALLAAPKRSALLMPPSKASSVEARPEESTSIAKPVSLSPRPSASQVTESPRPCLSPRVDPAVHSLESGGTKPALSLERDFKEGETIGQGGFGRVFSARHRVSGRIVAVKEMMMERERNGRSREQERLERELNFCEQLRHERIVRNFGHEYLPAKQPGTERLLIFLEYCTGGSLMAHYKMYGALDEPLVAKYTQQLLEGLSYLHSLSPPVVHRDLKCANLLLTHDANLKIADFGCSKWLCGSGQHSLVGSVFWTAPELLRTAGSELSCAVDLWSFSCCVLEMATAQRPWAELEFDNAFQACIMIINSEELPLVPDELPQDVKDVIHAGLQRDPAVRTPAADLQELSLLRRDSTDLDCFS